MLTTFLETKEIASQCSLYAFVEDRDMDASLVAEEDPEAREDMLRRLTASSTLSRF